MIDVYDLVFLSETYRCHRDHLQRAHWMDLLGEGDYQLRRGLLDWAMHFVCSMLHDHRDHSEANLERAKACLAELCRNATDPVLKEEREMDPLERFTRLRQYGNRQLEELQRVGYRIERLRSHFETFTRSSAHTLVAVLYDEQFAPEIRASISERLIFDYYIALRRLFAQPLVL